MIAMDAMIGSFVGAADIPVSTHTRAKRASSACPHKSAFCKRGSVNVRFAPKATEVLRCREWRGCGRTIRDIQLCRFARSANAAVFAGSTGFHRWCPGDLGCVGGFLAGAVVAHALGCGHGFIAE